MIEHPTEVGGRADSPLTWHGRPVLTVALAAWRHGVDQAAMRQALRRPPMRDLPPIEPTPIDARTPTWWQDEFDANHG